MKEDGTTRYEDGIYVGYRHFDKNNIKPRFPFGFGLSYTTFEYKDLNTPNAFIQGNDLITLSAKIKNSGKVAGQEIVQLYIKRAIQLLKLIVLKKNLRGLKKISLKPGEEKIVNFTIDQKALSYFDPKTKKWITEPGDYEIMICSSSEDINLVSTIHIDSLKSI